MKKILIVFTTVCLLFSMSFQVMAERMAYMEYEHEGGNPNYGPTFGYQWDIDPLWIMALEFQLDGAGENNRSLAAEITRRVYVGMTMAVRTEISDSLNQFCYKFNAEQNLNDSFQLKEGLSYTKKMPDYDASDYSELELDFGVANKLSNKFKVSLDTAWTQVRYSDAKKSSLNYKKWELTPKVRYFINQQLQLSGGYSWKDSTKIGDTKDNYVIGAEYLHDNYTFYFEYKFPVAGNTSTIGASYKF